MSDIDGRRSDASQAEGMGYRGSGTDDAPTGCVGCPDASDGHVGGDGGRNASTRGDGKGTDGNEAPSRTTEDADAREGEPDATEDAAARRAEERAEARAATMAGRRRRRQARNATVTTDGSGAVVTRYRVPGLTTRSLYQPRDVFAAMRAPSPSIMLIPMSRTLVSAMWAKMGRDGTVFLPLPSLPSQGAYPFRAVLTIATPGDPGMMSVACDPVGVVSGPVRDVWGEIGDWCPTSEDGFERLFEGRETACAIRLAEARRLPRAVSAVAFGIAKVERPYQMMPLPNSLVAMDSDRAVLGKPYDPTVTWEQLEQDGWTQEMAAELLPEPYPPAGSRTHRRAAAVRDSAMESKGASKGRDGLDGAPMPRSFRKSDRYDRWLVGVMDMSVDVIDAKMAAADRRQRERSDAERRRIAERRLTREQVSRAMDAVHVRLIDDDAELVRRALDSERRILESHNRRSWGLERAGEETIQRWVVNYIRHELTDYDEFLYEMRGHEGFHREQYYRYQHAVLSRIGTVYPKYAAECRRHLKGGYIF